MLDWARFSFLDDLSLQLVASETGIREVAFCPARPSAGRENRKNPILCRAADQLHQYFAGKLREFHLPLDMVGTSFQLGVWRQLERIPYGETRSYAQIARAVGKPNAVRAVGAANGANPVAIIVPCHRVVGSSGKLTGYGGGLPLKEKLLRLEGALSAWIAV